MPPEYVGDELIQFILSLYTVAHAINYVKEKYRWRVILVVSKQVMEQVVHVDSRSVVG